jgi:hypothetical protein
MADGSPPRAHVRHAPQEMALWRVLRSEAGTLMESAASAGAPLPRYVQDELHASLRCGVLACGFARARCPDCGRDKLVAFSCKKRGVCPSCGGRRMSETAAERVTRVVPEVPVRQWVLSLPWALRLPVARDSTLLTKVARIFFEAIREHLRAKVGGHGPGERVEVGAITFVQRFGGALNLNPHLHVLVADGAFVCPEDGRAPRFVATVAPTRAERVEVLRAVATRVARITTVRADDGLDALRAAATARGTVARLPFGEDAGGEDARFEARQRGVEHAGFNLHARLDLAAARPPSAGVAAVRCSAGRRGTVTKWDWATLLKRVWGAAVDALTKWDVHGLRWADAVHRRDQGPRGHRADLEAHRRGRRGAEVREGARSLRPVGVRAGEHARRAGRVGG